MSTSYLSYIGTYIELPNDFLLSSKKEKTILSCVNKECKDFHKESSGKFCSSCGNPIVSHKIEYTINSKFDYYDFADNNNLNPNALTTANNNILIPNLESKFSHSFYNYDIQSTEINIVLINNSINEFKHNNNEFINLFKITYNIDLSVKYGLVMFSL